MKKYGILIFLCCITIVAVNCQGLGDVNVDETIDIVDALLVAQFYVGLNPVSFNVAYADVNGDSTVDIVDALLIAQYYVGLISEFPGTGTTPQPTQAPTATPGEPGNYQVVGYFTQWGVYDRNFHVKNLIDNGSAEKLTVINYAFGNIVDCECVMVNQSGVMDAYADYQKSYTAEQSVDGVADIWDQPLRGNFNQLKKLKALYPHVKVLISLGGWTWSDGFHEAALNEANRVKTAQSCIDIYIKGNLPVDSYAGGPGAGAGVFDGIDIDWEYPNNPGDNNPYGPEDVRNFTLLLQEFRKQLSQIDPSLLLTIAGPGGESMIDDLELGQIHESLDWINLMTYDYHGGWDPRGPTNHMSALYGNPEDPSTGADRNLYSDYTVQLYLAGGVPGVTSGSIPGVTSGSTPGVTSGGVPPGKLNLGIPFYGRGWEGVTNLNNGLYQPASNPARGTWEQGMDEYKAIKAKNLPLYTDPVARASWCFNGNTFWSFDTPDIIMQKMAYVKNLGLGGAMCWELSGDTVTGELMTAIRNGL